MQKKKIYLITSSFPYGIGEKTFILPELSEMKKTYDVTIVSTASEKEVVDSANETQLDIDVKVVHVNYVDCSKKEKIKRSIMAICNPIVWKEMVCILKQKEKIIPRMYNAFGYFVYSSIFIDKLKKKVELNKDSIFYTYWNKIPTLGLACEKERIDYKLITRMHGHDLYNERVPCGRQPFRNYLNEKLDAMIFVSQKGYDYYKYYFLCGKELSNMYICEMGVKQREKIKTVYKDYFELVSCSNVIPLKRVELIIEALSLLDDEIKIRWTHFGTGDKLKEMKSLAEEKLYNKNNISYCFKGQCSNEEVIYYYRSNHVDCFILTSETEGIPVSIQEALSCGIPIIVTDVGGVSETFRDNGVLLKSNPSFQEISDAILKIYNLSIDKHEVLRQNSFELWKERFDISKNVKRFMNILEKL